MPTLDVVGDLIARMNASSLGAEAFPARPKRAPARCIVVKREGGRRHNRLIDGPGVGILCYAPTESAVTELSDGVADLMDALPFSCGYALVEQEASLYSPDPETKAPRWYLSYTIKTYLTKEE